MTDVPDEIRDLFPGLDPATATLAEMLACAKVEEAFTALILSGHEEEQP